MLLPDLKANKPHQVKMHFTDAAHCPANRAWLPLGAYLRHSGGVETLPPMPAGRQVPETKTLPLMDGLRLVPPPEQWRPNGENLATPVFALPTKALLRLMLWPGATGWDHSLRKMAFRCR